jgi:hypothetical protein
VKDQKKLELIIPPRINLYLTHVDPQASEQVLNRQLVFETFPDSEQDNEVEKLQDHEAMTGETMLDVDLRVLICRRIYARIKEHEPLKVIIPFANQIKLAMNSNRRLKPQLFDMIRGYTILNYQQRQKDENGNLIAQLEDYYKAKRLFMSRVENTVTHLTEPEKKIVNFIIVQQNDKSSKGIENGGCSVNEIADGTGLKVKQIYPLINGVSDKPDSGLLFKVEGMRKVDRPNVIGRPTTCYKIENTDIWKFTGKDFVSLVIDPDVSNEAECSA